MDGKFATCTGQAMFTGKKTNPRYLKLKQRRLYAKNAILSLAIPRKPRADPETGKFLHGRPKRLIPKAMPRKYIPKITGAKRGRPKKEFNQVIEIVPNEDNIGINVQLSDEEVNQKNLATESSSQFRRYGGKYLVGQDRSFISKSIEVVSEVVLEDHNLFDAGDRVVSKCGPFVTFQGVVQYVEDEHAFVAFEEFTVEQKISKVHYGTLRNINK